MTLPHSDSHPEDDSSIESSDALLRFVPSKPSFWISAGRPSTAAFHLGSSERGLSFYLLSVLRDNGLDDGAVLQGRPGYGLLALSVAAVRELGCAAVRDPVESDPPREDDIAHALVIYPQGLDKPARTLIRDDLMGRIEVRRMPR